MTCDFNGALWYACILLVLYVIAHKKMPRNVKARLSIDALWAFMHNKSVDMPFRLHLASPFHTLELKSKQLVCTTIRYTFISIGSGWNGNHCERISNCIYVCVCVPSIQSKCVYHFWIAFTVLAYRHSQAVNISFSQDPAAGVQILYTFLVHIYLFFHLNYIMIDHRCVMKNDCKWSQDTWNDPIENGAQSIVSRFDWISTLAEHVKNRECTKKNLTACNILFRFGQTKVIFGAIGVSFFLFISRINVWAPYNSVICIISIHGSDLTDHVISWFMDPVTRCPYSVISTSNWINRNWFGWSCFLCLSVVQLRLTDIVGRSA